MRATEYPLSTFSIEVDTASYSIIRRFLLTPGQLPPKGAVRRKFCVDLINLPSGYAPSLNPVYSYVKRLDALECLAAEKLENPRPLREAKNGPPIPDTSGQNWHYIENVSYGRSGGDAPALRGNPLLDGRRAILGGGVMSFEETFEQDTVFVSMRFPYTYGYNEAFLKKLAGDYPWVKLHTIGRSKQLRFLRAVQIGEPFDRDGKQKPTVVIYAREHGNEHDTSHLAEGAIRFLVSGDLEAAQARADFCFIIIPLLDPDGAAEGKYDNITNIFFWGDRSREAVSYAGWFKRWMDDGRRIDLVFNLHNVRSFGTPHFSSPEMEPVSGRLRESQALHQFVVAELKGFEVGKNPARQDYSNFRLGGWLRKYYSALCVPYEANSQAASRHLTILELREMGAGLVRASTQYLQSSEAKPLVDGITKAQAERLERWKKIRAPFQR